MKCKRHRLIHGAERLHTSAFIKGEFHFGIDGQYANEVTELGGILGSNRRKVKVF